MRELLHQSRELLKQCKVAERAGYGGCEALVARTPLQSSQKLLGSAVYSAVRPGQSV